MPELPDVLLYLHALDARVVGERLHQIVVRSPFVVRTFDPPLDALHGQTLRAVERLGKRIVFDFDSDLFLVIHPMIAGRFQWKPLAEPDGGVAAVRALVPKQKVVLAAFLFENGCLLLTEAGSKKRASMHVVRGRDGLAELDPGGADIQSIELEEFQRQLTASNRTLKRALTDPRAFSGIGNAYSDEILHHAQLSPVQRTGNLSKDEIERLHTSCQTVLDEWATRLRERWGDDFPKKVSAFQPEMAVHGKFGEPCPVCGTAVQRIRRTDNECNYCPRCQTGGTLLRDRALSRLLREEWPKTIEAWEEEHGPKR